MSEALNEDELAAMLRNLGEAAPRVGETGEDAAAVKDLSLSPAGPEGSAAEQSVGGSIKKPLVQRVDFPQLKTYSNTTVQRPDRHLFRNIPLVISGELGTAEITVRELLELEEGSVVKLDKMAGESATVLINEQYLGQAEIVVVNDRFGLRITAVGREDSQEEKGEQDKGDTAPRRHDGKDDDNGDD